MTTSSNGKRKRTSLRHHFAARIRQLRKARRWSQQDLAALSGLHRTGISLIERARCNVTLDSMERLADAFDVPTTDAPPPVGALVEHCARCSVPAQRVGLRALALRFAPLLVPRSAATLPPSKNDNSNKSEQLKKIRSIHDERSTRAINLNASTTTKRINHRSC